MTAGQTGTRLLVSAGFITFPGERNHSQDARAGRESPRAMRPSHDQVSRGSLNEGLHGSPAPKADSTVPSITDPPLAWGSAGAQCLRSWGMSPLDSPSWCEACQSGPEFEDMKAKVTKSEEGTALAPVCPLPVPALGSHGNAEAAPHVLWGSGPDSISTWAWFLQLQISRGPCSSGTLTCLPKTETANSDLLPKQDLSWGVGGCGVFPQPAPRGPGCPLEPKRPELEAERGPDRQARQQPQSVKMEVMLLKLKKPPTQKRRRRKWQGDRQQLRGCERMGAWAQMAASTHENEG